MVCRGIAQAETPGGGKLRACTAESLRGLSERVVRGVASNDAQEAMFGILESFFDVPRPKKDWHAQTVTARKCAKGVLRIASGIDGSAHAELDTVGSEPDAKARITDRSLWRYMVPMSMQDFMMQWRTVMHRIFQLARRRFGFYRARYGWEVYFDENQTLVFARDPNGDSDEGTAWSVRLAEGKEPPKPSEVSIVAGPSKDDAYSGRFRALTFQCLVARLAPSGILLPLDTVLVATDGPLLVDGIRVPSRSRTWIVRHFVDVLRALYPPPKLIAFDRGYHANENYAALYDYCRQFGVLYLTPAVRDTGTDIDDGTGTRYTSVRDFIEKNKINSQRIPGTDIRYVVAKRPVTTSHGKAAPQTPRTLLVFYRPRKRGDNAHEGAVVLDQLWAYAFYTNHPRPMEHIAWFERAYSRRWREEHLFAQRARFHAGLQHKLQRRVMVFMTGLVALLVFMLLRAAAYPVYDERSISRTFSLPRWKKDLYHALVRIRT